MEPTLNKIEEIIIEMKTKKQEEVLVQLYLAREATFKHIDELNQRIAQANDLDNYIGRAYEGGEAEIVFTPKAG